MKISYSNWLMFGTLTPLDKGKSVEVNDDKKQSRLHIPQFADMLGSRHNVNAVKQGAIEGQQDLYRDKVLHEEMFNDIVKRSQTILFHAKTVFPFDIFPNDIIIDLTKITVVTRSFFLSGYTQSVHIKDIMDVRVETGPFLSSLTVLDLGYVQKNKLYVDHMWRKDAQRARELLEGLIAASKAGVDITKIGRAELLDTLPSLARSNLIPTP